MNIDDQLTQWADEVRRTTTSTPIPIERFTDTFRGRRLVAVAATVVIVGGIAVAVAYASAQRSSPVAAGSAQPSQSLDGSSSSIPPPVAGTRRVDFHGLSIDVPVKWATDATECGTPIKDTVIIGDGIVASCAIASPPDVSSATFTTWRKDGYQRPLTDQRQRSITIGSHAATLTTGNRQGTHVTVLVVPDLLAQLTVETPSQTLGNQLVRTARVSDVDDSSCPARMPYIDLTSPPTTGPSDVMVSGMPVRVAICRYLSTFLEAGTTLSDAHASQLVTVLNALPSGLSAAENTYSPTVCRTPNPSPQTDPTDDTDNQDFTIRITYADAAPLVIYARLGACGALGVSNGTRTGQRTQDITQTLVEFGGSDVGWPGSVHPIN